MAYIPGFGHLSNPYIVFNDANGKPLSNGTVETYIAGTTTAYNTLKDWNGTYNGAIITLDIYGGCTIIAPETQCLKLIVKTSTGSLYKTFPNVFIGGSNQGYLPGTTVIRVDGTDGEIISVGTPDPDDPDKLIFTISLDPAITEAIATNASDISNIETSITNIEDSLQTKESLQYTGFRINSGSGPYFVKIAKASFQSGYGSMDLTCGVGGSSTAYGEFSVKVIRAINGTSMYAQWNSLFNRASTFQLEEIRCFYVGPNDIQLWAKTASHFTQSSLSFEPLINVRYGSSGVATGRAFSFQKVGTTGSYPSTYVNYCLAKSVDCLSASDQRRTNVTSSDASVEVTKTETYDGKGYTNTFDLSAQGGQVDTYKVKTSSADAVPGFTYDKIIAEGILTKNKAASDTFGEVLQLAALVETDGVTCDGHGTAEDPITVFRDISDNQNIWYLDTTNGLDTNSGRSRSAPKKTGDAVVIACKTAGKSAGRLVVMAGSSGVVFSSMNWVDAAFPFFDVVFETAYTGCTWNGIFSYGIFKIYGGIHIFNGCNCNGESIIDAKNCTVNGGTWSGLINFDLESYITVNGLTSTGDLYINAPILYITTTFLIGSTAEIQGRTAKIQVNEISGAGSIYSYADSEVYLDINVVRFLLEGGFQFPSQSANSSIKITAAKMARTATTKLLYLGAVANVTVNYQLIVDTMGSIVPMEIANPSGTVAGKVIELLKYENKVDAEIVRATAAEALKANKLTTVNNSTDTAYTFLASDANTCHIVNTSAATTRTIPSDSTAPDIAIGDSIEVQNLGTGVVTFVAASGVTIRSSLTLVMYGQYSVCMLRKIAANTWILTGERTAV